MLLNRSYEGSEHLTPQESAGSVAANTTADGKRAGDEVRRLVKPKRHDVAVVVVDFVAVGRHLTRADAWRNPNAMLMLLLLWINIQRGSMPRETEAPCRRCCWAASRTKYHAVVVVAVGWHLACGKTRCPGPREWCD